MDFIKSLLPQDLRDGLREALYPDERAERERDEKGRLVEAIDHSPQDEENGENDKKRADRAKAVSRAPRIVRELYDSDLLGINEAVKLGPRVNKRKPTSDQVDVKERAENGENQPLGVKGFQPKDSDSSQDDTNRSDSSEVTEKRNRAISRAPRIVRELYDSDLLGINEAVKLGPRVNKRKPTPIYTYPPSSPGESLETLRLCAGKDIQIPFLALVQHHSHYYEVHL